MRRSRTVITPEMFAAASEAMEAAHEQWLHETQPVIANAVPPQGRDRYRLRLDRVLYLLVRRKKDGSISRFFVACITVNGRTREHGLGPATGDKAVPLAEIWPHLQRLKESAWRERAARRWRKAVP